MTNFGWSNSLKGALQNEMLKGGDLDDIIL